MDNTFILVVGFDRDRNNLKSALKKMESLDPNNTEFPFTSIEKLFIASKDKEGTLEKLWKSSEEFTNKAKDLAINVDFIYQFKENKFIDVLKDCIKNLADKKKNNLKKIFGLVPIGIPGMGKTTMINGLKNTLDPSKFEITIVSQDLGRQNLIDEMKKVTPKAREEQLFQDATKKMRKVFGEMVVEAIEKTETISQPYHLILLDKGHAFKSIENSLALFRLPEHIKKFDLQSIMIRPECKIPFEYKESVYPFSLTLILSCLERAFTRVHDTLVGDEEKKALVVLRFLVMFKNYKIRDERFFNYGVSRIITLPFTNEETNFESKIPKDLIEKLGELLERYTEEEDQSHLKKFLSSYKASKLKFPVQNPDDSLKILINNIMNCIEK